MAKVETERFFGKKGIIIMIRDGNKMVSAIFKDKKNADKFNRNNPADVKKLLQLAKKTKFPKAIDEAKKYLYKKDALTDYFKGKLSAKELDKIAKDNFGVGIATKKELSSFLSNKFTQDVMSDTYGIPSGTLVKRVRGLMKFAEGIGEDTDVGHQDDEPNMLKSTALEIMEYGKKLMDKLDKYDDMEGEVDFPNWWQSKLTLAKDYLQKAYHYLDSEEKTSETIDRSFRTYRDDEGDDEGPVDEAYVVLYAPKKGVPVTSTAAYKDKKDAEKWAKSLGGITMIVKKKIKGIDETKAQINKIKKQVGKKEIKFYDALAKLEKKMGKKKYRDFLVKSLKDFKINGNHYDYRTNAAAEEKLFQVSEINTNEDLRNWFKSKWVNIGKKDKSGKHPPCGTSGKKRGYAKCVPAAKAATMTKKEKESATRRKRAAQNKAGRGGSAGGGGRKPINVSTHTKRSGKKSGTGKGS